MKFTKLNIGDTVATSGTRVFKKLTTEILPDYGNAGLYDSNDNLLASWDTLVNTYGMDVESDSPLLGTSETSPSYIFRNNSELSAGTKMIIADGVTRIGNYAFSGCNSLSTITIPNSVTSIGVSAFNGCDSLSYNGYQGASYLGNLSNPYLVLVDSNDCSTIIHRDTRCIYCYAFRGCDVITSITIPEGVTNIGDSAFAYCTNLESITVPNSVTVIDSGAFEGCTALRSASIGSVTRIPYEMFLDCASLTSIAIPNGVTSIEAYAFQRCTSLTAVTIPDGVTTIKYNAFNICTALASIIIPVSVTFIGDYAFASCKALKNVYYRGTQEQWNAIDVDPACNGYLVNTATKHYNYTG